MAKLLVALALTLSIGSGLANPIPTLTAVFLNGLRGYGIQQAPCVLAGPNTTHREAEGRAACFWFNPERAIGIWLDPWELIPIIEFQADQAFQERLPWVRDDRVELEGGTMRGLAQRTQTAFPWGDDGMGVWIIYAITPESNGTQVLAFNYYHPDEVSPAAWWLGCYPHGCGDGLWLLLVRQ